jgi:ADP-heptose:LPS heptosyltransferase/O-antigen/teichoic acid export membrane protein
MSILFQSIKTFVKQLPRHWVVASSAWISKIIVSLVQIVSIRTLLSYLGQDRYAVYTIAFSLTLWFSLADFGLSSSLQNFISEARAKKESYEKYIIAALQVIILLLIVTSLIIIFISSSIQEIVFRKFTFIQEIENINIILFVGMISATTAILSIVYKMYQALHKGYIPNIMPAVAAIISMTLIVLFNHYSHVQHSILSALLIFTSPQLFLVLITFTIIFKDYFAKIFRFNFEVIKSLFIRSLKFYGISILALTYSQIDYLVMSQTLNVNEIVKYNIFSRVFMFFTFIHIAMMQAIWPVSAEMFVKREFSKIKTIIKNTIGTSVIFIAAGTISVIFFANFIIKVLAPGVNITPPLSLILLLAFYTILTAWQNTFASLLQSMNVLRIFWLYLPPMVVINVLSQYFMSKKYGCDGIVLGHIISMMLVSFWVLPVKIFKILKIKKMDYTMQNILIAATFHIGDFIWSTSAIAIIKKTYPKTKITVLAPFAVKELIHKNPIIDEAIYIPNEYCDCDSIKQKTKKLFWALKKTITISKRKFDTVFILDCSRVSVLISRLARIPKRIGANITFNENICDPLTKYYTDIVILKNTNNRTHMQTRLQNIVKYFLGIYNNSVPVFPNSTQYEQYASSLINRNSNINIAFCMKGSKNSKILWNIENFKNVIASIDKYYQSKNISFYLVGTKNDFNYCQSAVINNNTYNLCGKTSLLELKEFLNKMDILISCDTGTVHIAAATKTSILALYGPMFYANYIPISHRARFLFKNIPCSPCLSIKNAQDCPSYPNPECMSQIIPEEVTETVIKILKNNYITN